MSDHASSGPAMRRSVVITGGANGIGRAVVGCLATEGWRIVAVDLDEDRLQELSEAGSASECIVGDVSDERVLLEARRAAEKLGTLRGWVNNAALPARGRLDELLYPDIVRGVEVNLTAFILGCREAVRAFLSTRVHGAIVNLSSIHARAAFPGWAIYDACKGGIEGLTRYVCVEYGSRGIRCNALAPGGVETRISQAMVKEASDPEEASGILNDLAPMGRMADPNEVAGVVALLLGEQLSYMNGQVLVFDGGATARCYPMGAWPS